MSEDKYETLAKIGHGSFGIIRKVRRKADGFIMCRKEISYHRMSQKEREQLHAEFQILSHLRHPNIVAYYHREHLKASQDLHLYMEYCGNGDLGKVIRGYQETGERATESFVWSIFSQLIMALYRCHYGVDPPDVGTTIWGSTQGSARGTPKVPAGAMTILHRDLKPENVFLGEDNSVKLGDFGLSKMIKSHDFASTYVGTPFYMSPEICAAEKYTLKSDIWSLGCIIYELCAREPPFNANTHYQLVQKIKEGKVASLPELYSEELNQVIRDCLKVSPDKRPDTAQLLNLPRVKLMREKKEVMDLKRSLRSKEDALRSREKELNDGLISLEMERTSLDRQRDMIYEQMRSHEQMRRDWEWKARLEIDTEREQLRRRFEAELNIRVEAEARKHKAQPSVKPHDGPRDDDGSSATSPECAPSSRDGEDSSEDLLSFTDASEFTVDSPEAPKEPRRVPRTPFGRAKTFAGHSGTPMDIVMVSPSPMSIACLSLSPRRRNAASTRPRSPNRQISKIPSMTGMQDSNNAGSLRRKHSVKKDNNSDDALNKMVAKNSIKGRTLVELQQARAGGRPLGATTVGAPECTSPKRATLMDKTISEQRTSGGVCSKTFSSIGSLEPVAVWDPDRDEMPSPFLARQKHNIKV